MVPCWVTSGGVAGGRAGRAGSCTWVSADPFLEQIQRHRAQRLHGAGAAVGESEQIVQ